MQVFMVYGWREEGLLIFKETDTCIAPLNRSLPGDNLSKKQIKTFTMAQKKLLKNPKLLVENKLSDHNRLIKCEERRVL